MASAHPSPKTLGDFEIIREIGRGGMGVVYEARQRSLNRRVALKVLSSGLGLTEKAVVRFRREAEAAAKLHHTNIVPIYATGEEHGIHFYAMELIDGPSLDQVIRYMRASDAGTPPTLEPESTVDSPVPAEMPDWVSETMACKPESAGSISATAGKTSDTSGSGISSGARYFDQVARMIADVADALQHAHDEGVIHRDIKPSNLLLSAEGRLSLNDFGLARVLEQPGMTMSGEFVGSPLYMSPEQITAGRAPLDHRTDIYSLGATLYELLTLEPPFPGQQRDQVIGQILHKDPVPPRRSNRRVPVDLETICLKAMDKDPDRRYQTARQMAKDLWCYVNRFAISARRIGLIGRVTKWARRRPALAASYSLVVILIVVLLALLSWTWHRELEAAKTQTFEAALQGRFDEARQNLQRVRRLLGSTGWIRMLEGQIALHEGDYEQADEALREAQRLMPESTTAYALFNVAQWLSGNEDEYFRSLRTLEDYTSVDYYDQLFKGQAETWFLPKRALKNLNAAVTKKRADHLAKAFRSNALVINGMAEPSAIRGKAMARDGLNDISAVRQYWADTPWLLGTYVNANILMMHLSRELGEKEEAELYSRQAQEGVDQLLSSHDSQNLAAALDWFAVAGQDDRLRACMTEYLKDDHNLGAYTGVIGAIYLYRIGESQLALDAFRRTPPQLRSITEWARAFIQMGSPDANPQVLLAEFTKDLEPRKKGHSGVYLHLDWPVLRMLGVPQNDPVAMGVADAMEAGYTRYLLDEQGFGAKLAGFMRGECTETDLLQFAAADRGRMAGAHFTIGVNYLADGDRASAKKHFQATIATNFHFYYIYKWSLAFSERVDDPRWLPWLKR